MHPFPAATAPRRCVGDTPTQAVLNPFRVEFRFERMSLVAACRIEHVESNGTAWTCDCAASEGPPLLLHRLVQRPLDAVGREAGWRRTLRFGDGSSLRIRSEAGTECGQVTFKGGGATNLIF